MFEKTEPSEKGTITLKLNNVSTYMTKIGQRVQSPRQQLAGIRWHLEAFPSVIGEISYLSCYLEGVSVSKWTASVYATFRIVNKNGEVGQETSFRRWRIMGTEPFGDSRGFLKFVTSEELLSAINGFLVDDSVEICVEFSVSDVCGAAFNVFETVGALGADIKLKVGDIVFYANKGYLSVVSSVFRDMFALTEADKSEKEMEELELKDIEASEFKEFLGVVYPTHYPITDDNVISLFRVADRYDVQRVVADCEGHLRSANSVPWFDKLELAVDLDRDRLLDHLITMMTCDDLKTITQNDKKGQLGMDVLQALFDRHMRIHHP